LSRSSRPRPKEDKNQRQHPQNPDHVLEMTAINPLQHPAQTDADEQQDDNVRAISIEGSWTGA